MDIEIALRMAYRAGLENSNNKIAHDEDVVVSGIINGVTLRRFTVDDWTFDVKMVRALKVEQYGMPYLAAANITLNGIDAYVDTMVGRDITQIKKKDVRSIAVASHKLGAEVLEYDRINAGGVRRERIPLNFSQKK